MKTVGEKHFQVPANNDSMIPLTPAQQLCLKQVTKKVNSEFSNKTDRSRLTKLTKSLCAAAASQAGIELCHDEARPYISDAGAG
jgi:hypothetical protein